MEKINFIDYPKMDKPINSNNLKQMQTNIENAINGTVLYHTTGSNESITLSDNISNYDYVEIYYKIIPDGIVISTKQKSEKGIVGTPIILEASIDGYFENSYYGVRLYSTVATINGTTLTKPVGYNFTFKTDGTIVFNETRNDIYVFKVIGYKI